MAEINEKEKYWLSGYFENSVSFSILINIMSNYTVVFKPYVNISSSSSTTLSMIAKLLKLRKQKLVNPQRTPNKEVRRIAVQDFNDIRRILDLANKMVFFDPKRSEVVKKFEEAFLLIQAIDKKGNIKTWHKSILRILEIKDALNEHENKLEKKEWDKRIREALAIRMERAEMRRQNPRLPNGALKKKPKKIFDKLTEALD